MRFCHVIFGATFSQYLLTSVTKRHGDNYKSLDPEFSRKVKSCFYLNDFNTWVRIVESDILLYRNAKERFLDANFNIHKRLTNNGKLLNIIEYSKSLHKEENLVNYNDKVLGVTWND